MKHRGFILLFASVLMALCITTIPTASARKKEKAVETPATAESGATPAKAEKKPEKNMNDFSEYTKIVDDFFKGLDSSN